MDNPPAALQTVKHPRRKILIWVVAAFFISVVGFGDTEDVLLFGFYKTTLDTPLVSASEIVAQITFYLAPLMLVAQVVLFFVAHDRRRSQMTQPPKV